MNVSACLVTRGNVPMQPILDSLPAEWEVVLWNNCSSSPSHANPWWHRWPPNTKRHDHYGVRSDRASDLCVYGRYAAIEYASHDLIYTQDDDVIVSDPQAIMQMWKNLQVAPIRQDDGSKRDGSKYVVCNMPPEFRRHYPDSALVGFGACFHRDAPQRAFDRYFEAGPQRTWGEDDLVRFNRECDTVFTCLTPRVLVDIPKENMPYATDPDRLYRQPEHIGARKLMLDLVRQVRDAS